MCRSQVVRAAACAALMWLVPAARAGLRIVSHSVDVSLPRQEATFTLAFDHAPMLGERDALGRPLESFQYEIAPDCPNIDECPFTDIRAVVRGDEVTPNHLLPIRDGIETASDPSPASGGWGYVRGDVPFQLNGSVLSFSAPLSMLGNPDGQFAYRVFTTASGETTSLVTGQFAPLPKAVWTGGIALSIMGLLQWIGRGKRLPHCRRKSNQPAFCGEPRFLAVRASASRRAAPRRPG
jgi:hypothetical protein